MNKILKRIGLYLIYKSSDLYAIQVEGKYAGIIVNPERKILNDLNGMTSRKIVVVPGKLVNILK